ncbi:uncharacterized protein LOC107267434 isoform X3 [Cephus cinctus]|uniref:Uncharacterized protein LOC107267434 isoform X3 n=1 Tax=Cephus cinctus TaxID=211228 RepID=A0AAJ7W105_CEPCN|nr:uncharacterized protein LOC107267434 isoform X3 [Cephus cinctus]
MWVVQVWAAEMRYALNPQDACHDAWTQLRHSPMFGCICPNNHMKKRCDRIFSMVNQNPCIDVLPSMSIDLSGTDSALYPFDPEQENFPDFWLPPTSMYPYFLFPATTSTRTFSELERYHHRHEVPELPSSPRKPILKEPEPGADRDVVPVHPYPELDLNVDFNLDLRPEPDGRGGRRTSLPGSRIHQGSKSGSGDAEGTDRNTVGTVDAERGSSSEHDRDSSDTSTDLQHPNKSEHDLYRHKFNYHSHRHHHDSHNHQQHHDSLAPNPTPTVAESNPAPAPDQHRKKFAPRPTYEHRAVVDRMDDDLDGNELKIGGLPLDRLFDLRDAFEGFVDQVKVIAHPDNSTSFEVIESQLENPLIDADHQDLRDLKQVPSEGIYHHQFHHRRNQSSDDGIHPGSSAVASSPVSEGEKSLPPPPVKLILSSTCHHAYTSCKNDPDCRTELQPVLNHCELASCARNECMDALQQFYKMASHKHSMEIAFCLCKKSDGKRDECIVAQEKMHPTCAQRIEGAEMPACHSVAEACKEDKACKTKLVYFERSCAVDSVTKKCAGPPLECRKAMIGILGTELRLSCACKSADLTQIYDCLGWQRLLWVNPCVVDAQRDFHARRKHHHHPRTTTTSVTTSKVLSTSSAAGGVVPVNDVLEDNQIPEHAGRPQTEPTESSWQVLGMTTSTATATSATGATGTTGTRSTATTKAASPTTTTLLASTTTTLATTSTTISTTPRTTTTSTAPPRFCVVQRPSQSHQYIREGKGKRLYREDEPECSELCQCSEGEVLICNTICVDSSPCKTDFAFYNHAAPAYQAYRGRCLCYSGRFICMRPSPDAYSIPHGIFMFLGYSETDENLLRPHNNLTVLDAVSSLDTFMRQEVNNQTVCTLFLYNVTRENVIAVARLGTDNPALNGSQTQSLQHLLRIKEECASMLQELSEKINNRHQEVHTHPLLSIFKMAEVEIKLPYSSEATTIRSSCCLLAVALLAVLFTISRAPRSSSSSSTSSSSGRVDS